ncbi:HEL298Cp [Eremothecium sinecaudum]|uniref:HEL298Cp n=1 Tax=Eremothecium sinecaudum TaxID=45286 RepID=A0A109UZE5_9SACH|nr:HEL298Cp [Eremothecium sinecaudum]AMD20983.1 HEL298Cp [Eremothecium sinecaudum]
MSVSKYFHAKNAILSEGITYLARSQELFWVDVFQGEIYRVTTIANPNENYKVYSISSLSYKNPAEYPYDPQSAERVGCVFPIEDSDGNAVKTVLFGGRYGIGKLDTASGKWEYIYLFRDSKFKKSWARLRTNDGAVSPNGREIYIGLMTDFSFGGPDTKKDPEGCVLRVNLQRKECQMVLDNVHIPNAINWNPDSSKIYITDSTNCIIWEAPFLNGAPAIDKKRVFYSTKNDSNKDYPDAQPDGSFVDPRDGHLYTAVWAAYKIQEINPCGELVDEYKFPTPRISSCCLGPDGDVYATSAIEGNFDTADGSEVDGGSIYRLSILKLRRNYVTSSIISPVY